MLGVFLAGRFLDKHHITYQALSFKFPSGLKAEGLHAAPEPGFQVSVEELRVEWSWRSLLRGKPQLRDVRINGIFLESLSDQDSLRLRVSALLLNEARLGKPFVLDSLQLRMPEASYASGGSHEESPAGNSKSFSLAAIPGFEINYLGIKDAGMELRQEGQRQWLDHLELVLSGWKSEHLLDVGIQRLAFVYQDTLPVELVLENGALNEQFNAGIQDLNFGIPGASLHIAELSADLSQGAQGHLQLAPSYVSLGRIRQLYAGIDAILHPMLPDSTHFRLQGALSMKDQAIHLQSLLFETLDSTSMALKGKVVLQESPELDVRIAPFRTTRSNLLSLLAPQDYHRFYLWPHEMEGEVLAKGTMDRLGIHAGFDTREGQLMAEVHLQSDSLEGLCFSLDVWSDSVYVNGITALSPVPVPHGQLHFALRMEQKPGDSIAPLWIDITSDQLYTFDQYIHHIAFAYHGDGNVDSMHVSIQDTVAKLQVALLTPTQGDGTTRFKGEISHLFPAAFKDSLPEAYLSTRLQGSFLLEEGQSKVALELEDLLLGRDEQEVGLKNSRFELRGLEDELSLSAEAEGRSFLEARSGTRFPEFSMPLPDWLSQWPETHLHVHLNLEEDLVELLTGDPGSVVLDSLAVIKDSLEWMARASIPELRTGNLHLAGIQLEARSTADELGAKASVALFQHDSLRVSGITANLGYQDENYFLDLGNEASGLLGSNRLALLVHAPDTGYMVRLNDSLPVLINGQAWAVANNEGVVLDREFSLQKANLGISRGPTRLEASTDGQRAVLRFDSLNVKPLLTYVSQSELMRGQLNGQVELAIPVKELNWEATLEAYHEQLPGPSTVHTEGRMSEQSLQASLDLLREDASARATLRREGGPLRYELNLKQFDLQTLQYSGLLPSEMELSGRVSGQASGILDEAISANGFLLADSLYLIPPITGSPVRVTHDTLLLQERQVVLDRFQIKNANEEVLSLDGTIAFPPLLEASIHVHSDRFALLQNQDADSRLRGSLSSRADLHVAGNREGLKVTGSLQSLPGASISYTPAESFKVDHASQIVTFMDLDGQDSARVLSQESPKMDIDWDVALKVNESSVTIVLDEITQEYIRIQSQGELKLKTGADHLPMVFGSISSTEGRAFIKPPLVPELDLVIESATLRWSGILEEPLISFRGHKTVKGVTSGLSMEAEENTELVDYTVYVILDEVTPSEFELQFDLEVSDSEAQALLSSLPRDTRQAYAINLLVFGRIGTENINGNSVLASQLTRKLNEISRRNLKNTGLSFSSNQYAESEDGLSERERTDLNYALSRGFLNNKLKVSVGGSVGFYMDDMTMLPPASLIGDVELSYRLSERPTLILVGKREEVYEGIIDGLVAQESIGLLYRKSFPTFPLKMTKTKEHQTPGEE